MEFRWILGLFVAVSNAQQETPSAYNASVGKSSFHAIPKLIKQFSAVIVDPVLSSSIDTASLRSLIQTVQKDSKGNIGVEFRISKTLPNRQGKII